MTTLRELWYDSSPRCGLCSRRTCCRIWSILGILAILITASVLLGVSFDSIEPNEVGLHYNGVSVQLETDQVYTPGRYFLGVNHRFIKYPRTVQTVRLTTDRNADAPPVAARSRDGLPLTLDLNFNYRLDLALDSLIDLYFKFGEISVIQRAYFRIAANAVRGVAAEYSAFEFFTNRGNISAAMQLSLNDELVTAHAFVDSFQLLDIRLPNRFESARIRQRSAIEAVQRAQNELDVAAIEASTRVSRAKTESQTIIVNAESKATGIRLANEAEIEKIRARFDADATGYVGLQNRLQLSDDDLLLYVWMDALKEAQTQMKNAPMIQVEIPPLLQANA